MGDKRTNDEALNYMTEGEQERLKIRLDPPETLISFQDENSRQVGRLFFNKEKDNMLDFEGNATEAAQIMFQAFIKHVEEQLLERERDQKR